MDYAPPPAGPDPQTPFPQPPEPGPPPKPRAKRGPKLPHLRKA
jgi:hypothetical protein